MNMDVLFVRQGEYERGDAAFPLIEEAASVFDAVRNEIGGKDEMPVITGVARTEKGRPYLETQGDGDKIKAGISVSHSEDIWMCLFSEGCCGVDVQYVRDTDKSKVACRFFTPGERKYIDGGGDFFDVWCRREALGKYTGEGWFGKYPDSCPEGVLRGSVIIDGRELFFHDVTPEMLRKAGVSTSKDLKAVCLTSSPEEPMVRLI